MDVLSEVLHAVRLTGAIYFTVEAAQPWISTNPAMEQIGASMMPDAQHVIPFHILISGRAWTMPADRSSPPARVEQGDIIMFPFGVSHIITSDRDAWDGEPVDLNFYVNAAKKDRPFTLVNIGGDGEKARIVCGYLGCDASPFNPLLAALPKMMIVGEKSRGSDLMKKLLVAALDEEESNRDGTGAMLAKLSELMFVHAARGYIDDLPDDTHNWLSALRDEHVGKALKCLHAHPSKDWSVEQLARTVGMSRSVFAERFARFAGEPPMQYLGRWRMQLASRLLEKRGKSIGDIAEEVGYSSEAAFKRAFKRFVGVTPGKWRKAPVVQGAVYSSFGARTINTTPG